MYLKADVFLVSGKFTAQVWQPLRHRIKRITTFTMTLDVVWQIAFDDMGTAETAGRKIVENHGFGR